MVVMAAVTRLEPGPDRDVVDPAIAVRGGW